MKRRRFLVANFALRSFSIKAEQSPIEGGTVAGYGDYDFGQSVSLTAVPSTGYDFTNWTEDGLEVSTSPTLEFIAKKRRSLVANFTIQTFTISAEFEPLEGGTITGAGDYNYGQTITLIAVPATDYEFVHWTENGSELSLDPALEFTVTEDRNLVALFSKVLGLTGEETIFQVYPNPTQQRITISPDRIDRVKLYDASGSLLLESTSNELMLDDLPPGKYTLLIFSGDEVQVAKVVKY